MGSFSHLDFPAAKTKERWYTPLRAAINEKEYFIKEMCNDDEPFFMMFNQDGRPNEIYFGFEDILKYNFIWNNWALKDDFQRENVYNVNKISQQIPATLVEILMDKIIWEHISPILHVEKKIGCVDIPGFFGYVNISIMVRPSYPDKIRKVEKWMKSLHIPFNLKQAMPNRLIRRRSLDLFMILKHELSEISLIAKMPSAAQENIVIKEIMKVIVNIFDNTNSETSFGYYSANRWGTPSPYLITLEIHKNYIDEDNETIGDYMYYFSNIKLCNQAITTDHEIIIA